MFRVTIVRVYVDIGKFWPVELSVNAAYEQLLIRGAKVDRRTLSAARSGTLARSEYLTLLRLRDWVRDLTGNSELTIDDLLRVEDD
ncbi:hypothetical protein V0288_11500 [Pannus brasiliensis CCIBt3594]|uniref:Uncharacterized protein n=1 Tax=Pannus brasiliensis CCIBt3594 TaxID=1427578 RepID=A0AAW9QIW7_9CHRO